MKKNINRIVYPLFGVLVEEVNMNKFHLKIEPDRQDIFDVMDELDVERLQKRGISILGTHYGMRDKKSSITKDTVQTIIDTTSDFTTTFYRDWNERNSQFLSGAYLQHVLYQYANEYGCNKIIESTFSSSKLSKVMHDPMVCVNFDSFSHNSYQRKECESVYNNIAKSDLDKIISNIKVVQVISVEELYEYMIKLFRSKFIPSMTDMSYLKELITDCIQSEQRSEGAYFTEFKDEMVEFYKNINSLLSVVESNPFECRQVNTLIKSFYIRDYMAESADEFFQLLASKNDSICIKNRLFNTKIRSLVQNCVLGFDIEPNKSIAMFIFNNLKNNQTALSKGFNRWKHSFIAIKNTLRRCSEKKSIDDDVLKAVNRLTRLSKKNHEPWFESDIRDINNESISDSAKILKSKVSKYGYDFVDRRFHTINIRNNTQFNKMRDIPKEHISDVVGPSIISNRVIHDTIINDNTDILVNNLQKKLLNNDYDGFFIPKRINFNIPLRRKGIIDNIPIGSVFNVSKKSDNNDKFCFGIHWKIRTDYDLAASVVDVAYRKNDDDNTEIDSLSFDTTNYRTLMDKNRPNVLLHSGDITSPGPNGATELIMLNDIDELIGKPIFINVYKFNDHVDHDDKSMVEFGVLKTSDFDYMKNMTKEDVQDKFLFSIKIPRSLFKDTKNIRIGYIVVEKDEREGYDYTIRFVFDLVAISDDRVGHDYIKDLNREKIDLLMDPPKRSWVVPMDYDDNNGKKNYISKKDFLHFSSALKDLNYYLKYNNDLNSILCKTKLTQVIKNNNKGCKKVLDISYEVVKNNPTFWDMFFEK